MTARASASPYGDFECRAARVVARSTGLKTVIQDDNRIPRTPDMRIELREAAVGFVEVVTTADGARADHLRAFANGNLSFETSELSSTWWVSFSPLARRQDFKSLLTEAFSRLERRGDHKALNGLAHQTQPPEIVELKRLGFVDVICDPRLRNGPGMVIGAPEGLSGPVNVDWDACSAWIDDFLASDLCRRKCSKLLDAGDALERHLYVGVTGDAPWSVHRVLDHELIDCHLRRPPLPEGVTHLWLDCAEFPGRCISWWPDRGWFDVRTRWATD